MKLVETVTRRVVWRLHEDAEQDRLFRKQALNVYKELVEYLKNGGKLNKWGDAVTIDQFTDLEQNVSNPLKIQWKHEDDAKADAAYANVNGQPTITLFVMDQIAYNDPSEHRQKMVRGLENRSKIFMHEYIHYLDDKRTKLGIDDLAQYNPGESKNYSEYFSDSFEVNAYFQSGLAQLEHTLEVPGLLQTRMERDWNSNFRDFKDWFFDEYIPPVMQHNISDNQEKRLINRLYGFWTNYIEPNV